MTDPLVSVLIPCYNAERWIGRTLESVFAQTWSNLEIIVVNDGSRDASESVVRRLARKNLKLISQDNRGQCAALNRALSEAQGQVIQYLDADDLLAPQKIALQMDRLGGAPRAIASCEWARFYDDAPETARFEADNTWRDLPPVDWLVHAWHDGGGMLFPARWLLHRAVVDEIGPWREDLTLNNDAEYFCRAVLASDAVLFCPGARVFYRSGHPASLSGLKSRAGMVSQSKVIAVCEQQLLAREDSDRTRRALALVWQRFAHASYPHAPDLADQAMARARTLHETALVPDGGWRFKLAVAAFGWRVARRLQYWSGRP
jgi:glycosyltransferase involved in cell wall biosynthesis